jgi:hypothetical protein
MRLMGPGYGGVMSTSPQERPEDRPVEAEGVPAQEDVEAADAARQVDEDPEDLANYTDSEEEKARSGNVDADPSRSDD